MIGRARQRGPARRPVGRARGRRPAARLFAGALVAGALLGGAPPAMAQGGGGGAEQGGLKDRIWIVIRFAMPGGRAEEVSFGNRSRPGMSVEQCERDLARMRDALIRSARQRRPALREGAFVDARCVQAPDDPVRAARRRR